MKEGEEVVGVCRLCLENRPLRRSHVLPEFGYAKLYDSRHRFYRLGGVDGVGWMQKGHRERLLCSECEGPRLNPHETYASGVLRGLTPPRPRHHSVQRVDYRPFKLFEMSLLWRMHVSRDPLFKQVDLGAVHAERLRTMLLAGDPGPAMAYPCGLFALTFEQQQRGDFINVWRHRRDGHHEYNLIYAGYVWAFVVSNHTNRHLVADIALHEDGRLVIGSFEMSRSEGLGKYARGVMTANREGVERLHARERPPGPP